MSAWLNIWATWGECDFTLYLVAAGWHWSNWFDIFIESQKGVAASLNIWAAWEDCGFILYLVAAGLHWSYWFDSIKFIYLQKTGGSLVKYLSSLGRLWIYTIFGCSMVAQILLIWYYIHWVKERGGSLVKYLSSLGRLWSTVYTVFGSS